VIAILNEKEAFENVTTYIGDGVTLQDDVIETKENKIKGHSSVNTQLHFLTKYPLKRIIFVNSCKENEGEMREMAVKIYGGSDPPQIMVAHDELVIDFIEETENTIRIPVGGECSVTATISISKSQGISALYCGREKKIRTYLFAKAKGWTITKAKEWVSEHKNMETVEQLQMKYKEEEDMEEGRGENGEMLEEKTGEESLAEWTTEYKNDLPDSAFLVILPGGSKDEDGKTVPRDLRKLPVKGKGGELDKTHVVAAFQSLRGARDGVEIPAKFRASALRKLKGMYSKLGLEWPLSLDEARCNIFRVMDGRFAVTVDTGKEGFGKWKIIERFDGIKEAEVYIEGKGGEYAVELKSIEEYLQCSECPHRDKCPYGTPYPRMFSERHPRGDALARCFYAGTYECPFEEKYPKGKSYVEYPYPKW